MKTVTFHFGDGHVSRLQLDDEQASALHGELGRAWNGQGGAMWTLMLGSRTHMFNLNLVRAVDVE